MFIRNVDVLRLALNALLTCTLPFGAMVASAAPSHLEATVGRDPEPRDASTEPVRSALTAAGVRTLERLRHSAASWSAILTASDGREIQLDIVQAPARKRTICTVRGQDGARLQLATIIERDDFWYVIEGDGKPAKYRAGEYPFLVATIPMFMSRAAIHAVPPAQNLELGQSERITGNIAEYRVPLEPAARQQIQGAFHQIEDLAKQDPTFLQRADIKENYRVLQDVLKRGVPAKIDLENGIFTETGATTSLRTQITRFKWIGRADDGDFSVQGSDWEDHSNDPTAATNAAERDDWVMIWHTLAVDPTTGRGDPDARLLDLKTGRMRRIPYDGETSIPGCFLKGRDKVVVTGASEGRMGLFEIDLKTRQNRQLAKAPLAGLWPMGPVLSPDGRILAVVAANLTAGIGHSQVFLIDVSSSEGRPLGKPFDTSAISWLPDGTGLVLVSRQWVDPRKPARSTICRMDLSGDVTPLRTGVSPVVLQGRRILFREDDEEGRHWQWMTCDLEGKDAKLFGDGLSQFGFAEPAPDGKRILMIRYIPGRGATPFVFRIGEQPSEPAVSLGGLWASPQWR